MRRALICAVIAVMASAMRSEGYIRLASDSNTGSPLFRPDHADIAFLVNTSITSGFTNLDGEVMITPSSAPVPALSAAEGAWAGVKTAAIHFQPLATTSLQNDPSDGKDVMTIADTAANRSIVGDYLAITIYSYAADNSITDTDIIFNPRVLDSDGHAVPFSTDHELNTYDLRSVATHEIGHALGANHSGVIGATMNFATSPIGSFADVADATAQSTLSSDDIAFVNAVYPASSAPKAGAIRGTAAFSNGHPILGGLVVALNASAGTTIGGMTSMTDGTFTISPVPPGEYVVYVQPLDDPVTAADLGISAAVVTNGFRTTFAGGNGSPWSVGVSAGITSTADIIVDPTPAGLQVTWLGVGSAGGSDWSYAPVKTVNAGYRMDLLLWGAGLDMLDESAVRLLGPGVTAVAGTFRTQPSASVDGLVPVRFTVDIAPSARRTLISVGVVKGTDAVVRSGGLVVMPHLIRLPR